MDKTVPLAFFYKDGFGIKQPTKVDIPLNKETEAQPKIKKLLLSVLGFGDVVSFEK